MFLVTLGLGLLHEKINGIQQKNKQQGAKNECVQVVVRCRPLNNKEQTGNFQKVVDVFPSRGVIEILNCNESSRENKKMFTYDAVYDKE
ncbi:hypothetical protein pipiens_019870 [Culex pipiens pipiens]|uniref:Kinesin motor domain-containing protein n=1 Tax=Culex pipiens pipiens TaxID=38569 RepID=A0ABD1DR77_CULPP